MVNIFGVILLNTLYICYNFYKVSEKDYIIKELESKVVYLENELLKRNEFIANELQKEFGGECNKKLDEMEVDVVDVVEENLVE